MKLKNKKISLLIAAAMCVFTGALGVIEAAEQNNKMFDTVEFKNNIKYNVDLTIYQDAMHAAGQSNPVSIEAGRSKVGEIKGEVGVGQVTMISISTKDKNVVFDPQSSNKEYLREKTTLYKYDVFDNGEYLGMVFVVFNKVGSVLNVTIDSKDSDLKYGSKSCELK